ncbi:MULTISPECIES: GNAT family N-acetyltransferase [Pseudomonadati]|uniref:N-acetyltransferase n=1 Tax=Shewanella aestuarii TaxID=1028752 RepID=A0ABT0L2G1_9GAMM|nr:GNAT family N-acetyltransferase [Shewanella aestuarii]MCL1117894.1 N-acetyltransferase [Shewanella aestuarii]GGN78805.1 N-acetyltransferase [Shewanella aestuarii]
MTTVSVIHQAEMHRFLVEINQQQAILEYRLTGHNVNFHHTFVPPAMRGKGVAESLVRTGLSWAKQQQLTIEASCSYVQKFLG